MAQVEAKQRIKVATKDHILITRLHLRLHSKYMPLVYAILIFLALVIFIVVGIARPNIKSEWKITALQVSTEDRSSS